MTRQIINLGTADKGNGDPIRVAFEKANDNFAELYALLAGGGIQIIEADVKGSVFADDSTVIVDSINNKIFANTAELGNIEITGSTVSTSDSSGINVNQIVNLNSDVNIGGNLIPNTANGGDLGSAAKPWKSLYVSNRTIFLGNVPLSLEPGSNELQINNVPISQTINYANIPNTPTAFSGSYADLSNKPAIPVDINDLTDTGNLLFDGDYTSLSNRPTIPVDIDDLTDTGNALASELVSVTVPTIGGTASANETGITYLSGELSKWAIFTEGAFTVGEWTDVQPGWTVTDNNGFTDTIAGRGSFGAASFQTTVNNWPSPASGKTYVFTSPDYQLGYTNPVEITVGSNDWTFDLSGVLTLPTGVTNNGRISNNNGISLAVDTRFWTFDGDGGLTFPDGSVQTTAYTGGGGTGDGLTSNNDINITVNSEDSSSYTWNFGQTGDLTAPKDIIAGGEGGGHFVIDATEGYNTSVRWYNLPVNSSQSLIRAYTGNPDDETELNRGRIQLAWQDENRSGLRIISYDRTDEENVATPEWTFTGYGSLELPEGGAIAEGVVTDNPTIELTPADPDVESQKLVIKGGAFSEELDDYHLHLTTGDLTETSVILGTDEHNVRTVTTGGVQINTHDYEVNASKTWRFTSTGDLYLPPSDPDNFFSGQIYASGDNSGFLNLNIQGMASEEDYGGVRLGNSSNKPVELWAGSNTIFRFDSDGSLTLPGDIKSESAINIDVNLTDSTLRRWTFGEDGDLNIPGNIVDSTGVNQTAQRVEGSWTVTAGTATYSFTVPMDGTYVMWVKGSIPNGIITWNATLSVTNSNVPAIGQQYAWNYTDGGSPILLTAIPNQIKGVAGTISTDATYVGTTSNRFDFGISNTSGASQTVYYGYTKI